MPALVQFKTKAYGHLVRFVGYGNLKFINFRTAQAGMIHVKTRLTNGIGSDDAPTKPLTKRYAIRKSRFTGHKAIRDLSLTGKTKENIQVRYADEQKAIAQPSTRLARVIAAANRDLLNFSPSDMRAMDAVFAPLIKQEFTRSAVPFGRGGRSSSRFAPSSAFRSAA